MLDPRRQLACLLNLESCSPHQCSPDSVEDQIASSALVLRELSSFELYEAMLTVTAVFFFCFGHGLLACLEVLRVTCCGFGVRQLGSKRIYLLLVRGLLLLEMQESGIGCLPFFLGGLVQTFHQCSVLRRTFKLPVQSQTH